MINKYQQIRITLLLSTSVTTLALVSSITGCSNPNDYNESYDSNSYESAAEAMDESAAPIAADIASEDSYQVENVSGSSEQTLGSQIAETNIVGKELVITANASFKVDDVVKSTKSIESLTREQGGYVALSDISNYSRRSRTFTQGDQDITLTTYNRRALMTVRIPRENVNDFMSEVQQQVKFLEYQEFKAQDVTLDIYREKLAEQLNRNTATELSDERLDSDSAEEQGSNVDSIVATYDARRREQLAKLQQMEINDRIKYSTIDLEFSQSDIVYKEIEPNLDSVVEDYEPSFFSQVGEAFSEGWDSLKYALIKMIGLWWLIPILFTLYLLFKLIKVLIRFLFKQLSRLKKSN